jgi:hypothetical protein
VDDDGLVIFAPLSSSLLFPLPSSLFPLLFLAMSLEENDAVVAAAALEWAAARGHSRLVKGTESKER